MSTGIIAAFRRMVREKAVLLAAFAAFYVLIQGIAAAHAVEYGKGEHTHNGEVCLLSTIANRDDTADIPPLPVMPELSFVGETYQPEDFSGVDVLPVEAARPRGPPSIR